MEPGFLFRQQRCRQFEQRPAIAGYHLVRQSLTFLQQAFLDAGRVSRAQILHRKTIVRYLLQYLLYAVGQDNGAQHRVAIDNFLPGAFQAR